MMRLKLLVMAAFSVSTGSEKSFQSLSSASEWYVQHDST